MAGGRGAGRPRGSVVEGIQAPSSGLTLDLEDFPKPAGVTPGTEKEKHQGPEHGAQELGNESVMCPCSAGCSASLLVHL